MKCYDCPRNCGTDREISLGFCQEANKIRVAKVIENFMWEEPCISGDKGALAIFFSGCNLKCSFCQNRSISHKGKGTFYTPAEFRQFLLSFDLSKFSCIDLITPTHFSTLLFDAFEGLSLPIPIVWNSSCYEKTEIIDKISKFVDIFLPDLKFFDDKLSQNVALAENYFSVASKALIAMRKNKPENIFLNNILQQGVLIRHLILPDHAKDSFKILDFIKENIKQPFISLMSQFIPLGNQFSRKIYPLEYKSVIAHAEKLGLTDGFVQEFESADDKFVPEF